MKQAPQYIRNLNRELYSILKKIPKKYRSEQLTNLLENPDYESPPPGGEAYYTEYMRRSEVDPSKPDHRRLNSYRIIRDYVNSYLRRHG